MPDLVAAYKEEYSKLSADEKAKLVEEYSEFKLGKVFGRHVSVCSKISDTTHTLKAIKNEVQLAIILHWLLAFMEINLHSWITLKLAPVLR